jgi:hypothetical protein
MLRRLGPVRPTNATLLLVAGRDRGCCARCGYAITGHRGVDWSLHHRRPAGMGGDRRPETHAPANLLMLHGHGSQGCHSIVESYRADSLKRGFLIPKGSPDPPSAFVIEHKVHGWVFLDDLGSWSHEQPEAS